MPNPKNFWAGPHVDGWAVRREGSDRASSVHLTQEEAWQQAKQQARSSHGEAFLQNRKGEIRERNTYGNDPRKTPG